MRFALYHRERHFALLGCAIRRCVISGDGLALTLDAERCRQVTGSSSVLVNPALEPVSGELVYDWEGCLSVPDYTGNVIRATHIKLTARDPHGETLSFDMEGYEARAAQHEIDHLDGMLFIDRVEKVEDLYRVREDENGELVRVPVTAAATYTLENLVDSSARLC